MSLLKVKDLSIHFQGLKAVSNFSICLEEGEIVAIIGPNGAGKTTVFNMLTGLYLPTEGSIEFMGASMVGKKPYIFTRNGIARTFQNIRLFSNVSVLDNLLIAQTNHVNYSFTSAICRTKGFYKREQELADHSMEMLKTFRLDQKAHFIAKNLPYGEQRRLEIARAMMTGPKLLLLDEPCAGMITSEINEVVELIGEIRERFGVTILLIEHHMSFVMSIAQRIKVLDFGETIAEGNPKEIQSNPNVIAAYLGSDYNAEDK